MSNDIVPMSEPPRRGSLRRSSFRFSGRPESVKAARDWLGARMRISGIPGEVADTALLLLSELATNSVRHTPSGADSGVFHVRAFFFRARLRVEVRDSGRPLVAVNAAGPAPDAEHGRGLLLVDTLAHQWGRFVSGQGSGMFFELRWGAPVSRAFPEFAFQSTAPVAHVRRT